MQSPAGSGSPAADSGSAAAQGPKFSEVLSQGVQQEPTESLPAQLNRNDLPPAFRTQAGRKSETLKAPRKLQQLNPEAAYLICGFVSTPTTPQSIGVFAIGTIQQSTSDSEAAPSASGGPTMAGAKADAAGKTGPDMPVSAAADIAFAARIRIMSADPVARESSATGTPDAGARPATEGSGSAQEPRPAAALEPPITPQASIVEPHLTNTASPDAESDAAAPARETSNRPDGRNGAVPATDPGAKDSRPAAISTAPEGNAHQGSGDDVDDENSRKSTLIQTTAGAHTAEDSGNTQLQGQIHVSTTDRSAAPPPQSASRPDPARAMEAPAGATPSRTPAAAREIALQLPNPGGARVDVQLTDRGGDVRVVVRTEDTELARDLRSNLPELSQKLSQSGMDGELVTPVETHVLGGGHEGLGQHNRQGADDSQSPHGGAHDSSASQDRRQQQQRREPADSDDAKSRFSGYFNGVLQ